MHLPDEPVGVLNGYCGSLPEMDNMKGPLPFYYGLLYDDLDNIQERYPGGGTSLHE